MYWQLALANKPLPKGAKNIRFYDTTATTIISRTLQCVSKFIGIPLHLLYFSVS